MRLPAIQGIAMNDTDSEAAVLLSAWSALRAHPQGARAADLATLGLALSSQALAQPIFLQATKGTWAALAGELRPSQGFEAIVVDGTPGTPAEAYAIWAVSGRSVSGDRSGIDFSTVVEALPHLWANGPRDGAARWAAASRLYDEAGPSRRSSYADEKAARKAVLPAVIDVLAAAKTPAMRDEQLVSRLERVIAARDASPKSLLTKYGNRACPRTPLFIPLSVLSERRGGGLSLAQVLAHFLVEHPDGPKLTHQAAAAALGMEHRQEVSTHLSRAKSATAVPPAIDAAAIMSQLNARALTIESNKEQGFKP